MNYWSFRYPVCSGLALLLGSCWYCSERTERAGAEEQKASHARIGYCRLTSDSSSTQNLTTHLTPGSVVKPAQGQSAEQESQTQESPKKQDGPDKQGGPSEQEQSLFDGQKLGKWSQVKFGGDGKVEVRDGNMVLGVGDPLTGVVFDEENLPQNNYEIELEARREEGIDFFCCLTFPVNDSHCSLVVGGWAGTVVGLSNLDDLDASRNETSSQHRFENQKWYRIKVRVEAARIQCWIDGEQVVDADITGREIAVRNEVRLCRPLGICTFQTQAGIRNIVLRTLKAKSESETGK